MLELIEHLHPPGAQLHSSSDHEYRHSRCRDSVTWFTLNMLPSRELKSCLAEPSGIVNLGSAFRLLLRI